jgi:SAM-dependent methyltransferase
MEPLKDAYGQIILALYEGKSSFELVEMDTGYISLSRAPSLYLLEYNDWPEVEKKAIKYAKGRVLDIGCGAGRHCLNLQREGYEVVGIDNSRLAIDICKRRGVKNAFVMPIEELSFNDIFDTVLLFGVNFGLFSGKDKSLEILDRINDVTSDNARIICSTRDPYDTRNQHFLDYHKRNRSMGRLTGQLRIRVRYRQYATDWFDYLLVSKDEMKTLLKGTGWKENHIFFHHENWV